MSVVWTNPPVIGTESIGGAIVMNDARIREVGSNMGTTDRAERSSARQVTLLSYRNLGSIWSP